MALLEVRINGEAADIGNPQDFRIIISRSLFNFEKPTSQEGDYTYDMVFPATKTNARIFGPHLVDVGAVRKFVSVQSMEAEIYADGRRIFIGTPIVDIVGAGSKGGYRVVMYSRNIDWVAQLQSKSLRDIQSLDDVPFTGSRFYGAPHEPVSPLRQEDIWLLGQLDTVVQFPPVAYGNYFQSGSTLTGLLANKVEDIQWQDIAPCAYVPRVVKAMFEDIGYKLAGGFFDSVDAQDLITAYTGDSPPRWNWGLLARASVSNTPYTYEQTFVPAADNSDFVVNDATFWIIRSGTENWDYSESYFQSSPDEQYLTPVSGSYRISIDTGNLTLSKGLEGGLVIPPAYDFERTAIAVVIIPSDADELLELQESIADYIRIGTVTVVSDSNIIAFYDFGTGYSESPYTLLPFTTGGTYSQSVTGIPGTAGASLDGSGTVTLQIENVQLPQNTRLAFWLISQFPQLDPVSGQEFTFDAYELDIKETSYPDLLQVAPLLPDMSQFDYLKSRIMEFNLCFSVDPERKVIRFETRDRFYRNNQFAQDFTANGSDIDTASRPVPFYQTSKLKWAEDESDALLSTFGTSHFSHDELSGSVFAIQESEVIESLFAPTYEREFTFKNIGGGAPLLSRVIFPCMASDSQLNTQQQDIQWEYNYRPRILRYIGMQPGYWKYEGGVLSEYPAARFSFSETGGNSLAFSDGAGRFIRNGGAIVTAVQNDALYRRFWAKFYRIRYTAHIQEVSVYLDPHDFASMDVSVPVLFHGIHYWLYAFVDGFDPVNPGVVRIDLLRQV